MMISARHYNSKVGKHISAQNLSTQRIIKVTFIKLTRHQIKKLRFLQIVG